MLLLDYSLFFSLANISSIPHDQVEQKYIDGFVKSPIFRKIASQLVELPLATCYFLTFYQTIIYSSAKKIHFFMMMQ
ncbi:MAG: hypothetical protein D3924_02190 [Candidatus Electrothrix sp. AR4]|nr:hypothetical protein [Candidatus Electrothrix sp. AR4]